MLRPLGTTDFRRDCPPPKDYGLRRPTAEQTVQRVCAEIAEDELMRGAQFPDLSDITVVVIDDLAFSRALTRTLLASANARRVEVAASVNEAWPLILSLRPDLIVVDWELTGRSGIDLCRMVRTSPESPNRFAAILMVTAYREEHRVRQAIEAGISTYLAKPFSPSEFLKRVKFCIEDRRAFARREDHFGPIARGASDPSALVLE